MPGLSHGDLRHRCEELLGSIVHRPFARRGLAPSLLGNHCRRAWVAPRTHPCFCRLGYASSVIATQQLCQQLDSDYLSNSAECAISALNQLLPASDQIPAPVPPSLRQRQLSQALDKVLLSRLGAAGPGREAFRAHFQPLPGAGAWLHAPPSPALGLHVAGPLFKTMVRLRLRLPLALGDVLCTMCDGVADSFGDHARVCPCGGDRTKRHHSLRTLVAARAQAAGFHTEIEKLGLLPPRSEDGEAPEDGGRGGPGRRPADVWIPQGCDSGHWPKQLPMDNMLWSSTKSKSAHCR